MIGQKKLLKTLDDLIDSNKLPRLMILVGEEGSGRSQICEYVGKRLGISTVFCENSADDVRETVANAYKTGAKVLNIFKDIDDMSNASKNALLKVIEEPPNGAYFIMTSRDIGNSALATIRSRGTVFYMDAYTVDELLAYAKSNYPNTDVYLGDVARVAETPNEVDLLMSIGVADFFDFVDLVIDNISTVSGANSFKIGEKISFKNGDGKYDLKLFLKIFMKKCSDMIVSDPLRYAEGVGITSKYLQELSVSGINKQFVFDNWLLQIREAWM